METEVGTVPVLVASQITKAYRRGRRVVLADVDLRIGRGEFVSITGENGSGKSTLLAILAGDSPPSAGSILRPGRVGYCPQHPALYPRLTADEHFELYARAARLPVAAANRVRDEAMAILRFEDYRRHQARAMSGGTRAKLSLALSLLGDPDLLILDEPYAAFDLASYQAFWDLLDVQREADRAVIVVAHLELDASRFDRRFELQAGSLTEMTA